MRYYRKNIKPGYSLEDEPKVWGKGPDGPTSLAFIGEAPGATEVEENEPFVGAAGRVFNWGLATAGVYRGGVWVDNVLPVKLPNNNWNSPDSRQALEHNLSGFYELIHWLIETKGIRVIVAFGNHVKELFGIVPSITKVRGSIYIWNYKTHQVQLHSKNPDDEIFIVPTYHPAHIARGGRWGNYGNKERGRADLSGYWISDLKKAKQVADGELELPAERFNCFPQESDIAAFRDEVLDGKYPRIAVDIETTSLDPWAGSVVVIGFAWSGEDGLSVPMLKQNGIRYWKNGSHRRVQGYLNDIFQHGNLVYQNGMFDVVFLRQHGYIHPMENVIDDTLLMHHAISPELPHNLGAIVSEYGTTPYWKDDFLTRGGSILDMDDEELRTYNLRDAVVLLQVVPEMEKRLDTLDAKAVYRQESVPLLPVLCEMMETGVDLDEKALKKWKRELKQREQELEAELRSMAKLPDAFSLSSPDDLRLFLYGTISKKYQKRHDLPKKKPGTKVYENLLALQQIVDGTTPLVDLSRHRQRTTDSGKASTDKRGMLSIQRFLQNRLQDIKSFRRSTDETRDEKRRTELMLDWIAKFGEYRRIGKLRSTYTDFKKRADGRIHTEFVPTGTATGRLASRNPNMQNAPKSEKGVRRLFAAPEGWSILAADYSNLEVGTMAYECQDPELINIFEQGLNMHDINTRILFGLEPDDPLWKAGRAAAKTFQFGYLSYGGGANEVYEQIITRVPELRLTMKAFKAAGERYFEARPVYYAWRLAIEDYIVKKPEHKRRIKWEDVAPHLQQRLGERYIQNAFGRIRFFHGPEKDIHKEALNFPPQSDAASIINRASIDIYGDIHANGLSDLVRLQAQIHDELRFVVRKGHEREVFERLVEPHMTKHHDFYGRKVTFPVEAEYGPNWADLTPLYDE